MNTSEVIASLGPLLPVFIFLARIVDVSLGTLRTILLVRGYAIFAAGLGFFEITIWLFAISSVIQHLNNPTSIAAYAGGFAAGNIVGIWFERKLAMGFQLVRFVSNDPTRQIATALRADGFTVTEVKAEGRDGPVEICLVAVSRKRVPFAMRVASTIDPSVFTTVEDLRLAPLELRPNTGVKTGWRSIFRKK